MLPVKLISAVKTHKSKETPADCADAFCVSEDRLRVAVSDGVTRSLYPGDFAESLVKSFCQAPSAADWKTWLATARDRWLEKTEERVAELKNAKSPVFINNNQRLNSRVPGAATFTGVEFVPQTGIAKITLIGDSCVFVFADGKLTDSLPRGTSEMFDDQPAAFRSRAGGKDKDAPDAAPATFELPQIPAGAKGAHWVFATDALAKWILLRREAGENVLRRLLAVRNSDGLRKFAEAVRKESPNALNDDLTLVIIRVGEPDLPPAEKGENAEDDENASGAATTEKEEEVADGKSVFAGMPPHVNKTAERGDVNAGVASGGKRLPPPSNVGHPHRSAKKRKFWQRPEARLKFLIVILVILIIVYAAKLYLEEEKGKPKSDLENGDNAASSMDTQNSTNEMREVSDKPPENR